MLFSDADCKIEKAQYDYLLDYLKKYSYDNLTPIEKLRSPWHQNKGVIRIGENGIEVCMSYGLSQYQLGGNILIIQDLPKDHPNLKISKVKGNVYLKLSDLESLEDIFTEDCVITGSLYVNSPDLQSLKGCPKECDIFTIFSKYDSVPYTEIRNMPTKVNQIYWAGVNFYPNLNKKMQEKLCEEMAKHFSVPSCFPKYISIYGQDCTIMVGVCAQKFSKGLK